MPETASKITEEYLEARAKSYGPVPSEFNERITWLLRCFGDVEFSVHWTKVHETAEPSYQCRVSTSHRVYWETDAKTVEEAVDAMTREVLAHTGYHPENDPPCVP